MASKTCPKCQNKSENPDLCGKCGLDFAQYERTKLERLGEVHRLLSENRFREARELAEKLPTLFPDKRTDFVLLLSNITRDINIVDKYEQAQQAFGEGDHARVSLLLRNIKAFDIALNERVVGLRRRAERILQDNELFGNAVAAFTRGDYAAAAPLFKKLRGSAAHREEVAGYLGQLEGRNREILSEAVACINAGQFAQAESKLARLQAENPDLQEEIAAYVSLLAQRREIRERIAEAANRARVERRLLEAKILYAYLGLQFPESMAEIGPRLQEIGARTPICLADLQASGTVDLASLGVTVAGSGLVVPAGDMDDDVRRDTPVADVQAVAAVAASAPGRVDEFSPPVELDVEEVPDFIF